MTAQSPQSKARYVPDDRVTSPIPADARIAFIPADGDDGESDYGVAADLGTGGGGLSTVTATIDTATILTLFSDPPEIIPAPAAGSAIVVESATYVFRSTNSAYLFGGEFLILALKYDDGEDAGSTNVAFVSFSPLRQPESVAAAASASIAADIVGQDDGGPTADVADGRSVVLVPLDADDPSLVGGIVAVDGSPVAGGSGYAPGDTGIIYAALDSLGTVATYEIDTVDGGGAVLTYHIVTPGAGSYRLAAAGTSPTTGDGDAAFEIDITEITPADGDLYLTVTYRVVDLH